MTWTLFATFFWGFSLGCWLVMALRAGGKGLPQRRAGGVGPLPGHHHTPRASSHVRLIRDDAA